MQKIREAMSAQKSGVRLELFFHQRGYKVGHLHYLLSSRVPLGLSCALQPAKTSLASYLIS